MRPRARRRRVQPRHLSQAGTRSTHAAEAPPATSHPMLATASHPAQTTAGEQGKHRGEVTPEELDVLRRLHVDGRGLRTPVTSAATRDPHLLTRRGWCMTSFGPDEV